MKVLLVCAGGVSTSILMNKMMNYGKENNIELFVEAHAVQEFDEVVDNFDVVLIGPQISYKINELKGRTSKPVAVIENLDYALGKVENIINLAKKII